jgi:hypothetical protein
MQEISMNTVMSVVLALALTLSAMPALAGDTFQAFSTLPAAEQATLTPLPDDQLAAITGGDVISQVCAVCANTQAAIVTQANAALASAFTAQENESSVRQRQSINSIRD